MFFRLFYVQTPFFGINLIYKVLRTQKKINFHFFLYVRIQFYSHLQYYKRKQKNILGGLL